MLKVDTETTSNVIPQLFQDICRIDTVPTGLQNKYQKLFETSEEGTKTWPTTAENELDWTFLFQNTSEIKEIKDQMEWRKCVSVLCAMENCY